MSVIEGAEINDQNHRTKYEIKSKWRLLENAYGDYGKFTALEAEEIIVQTNTFSFQDSLKCRMLNWLIQMSWTLKRHNLILKLLKEFGINQSIFYLTQLIPLMKRQKVSKIYLKI